MHWENALFTPVTQVKEKADKTNRSTWGHLGFEDGIFGVQVYKFEETRPRGHIEREKERRWLNAWLSLDKYRVSERIELNNVSLALVAVHTEVTKYLDEDDNLHENARYLYYFLLLERARIESGQSRYKKARVSAVMWKLWWGGVKVD